MKNQLPRKWHCRLKWTIYVFIILRFFWLIKSQHTEAVTLFLLLIGKKETKGSFSQGRTRDVIDAEFFVWKNRVSTRPDAMKTEKTLNLIPNTVKPNCSNVRFCSSFTFSGNYWKFDH